MRATGALLVAQMKSGSAARQDQRWRIRHFRRSGERIENQSGRNAMLERSTPPFRADHVGSLIRPDALIAARDAADRHETSAAELKIIQEDAIRAVVRLQEDIGLKLVTDGEFNRGSWQRDF